jgi:hypothetical protein
MKMKKETLQPKSQETRPKLEGHDEPDDDDDEDNDMRLRRHNDDDDDDIENEMIEETDSVASNNENEERHTPTEIGRDQTEIRRSSRATRPPERLNLLNQETMITQLEYTNDKARLAALVISDMNAMHLGCKMQVNSSFAQTYSLRAGLEIWHTRKGCRDKGNFTVASPRSIRSHQA